MWKFARCLAIPLVALGAASAEVKFPRMMQYRQTLWGRTRDVNFPAFVERLPKMKEDLHLTHLVLSGWDGWDEGYWHVEKFLGDPGEVMRLVQEHGLRAVVASLIFDVHGRIAPRDRDIRIMRETLEKFQPDSLIDGCYLSDEPQYSLCEHLNCRERFRRWLRENFDLDELERHGIDLETVVQPSSFAERRENQFLWSLYGHFRAEAIRRYFEEEVEVWRKVAQGIPYFIVLSSNSYIYDSFSGSIANLGSIPDMLWLDLYPGDNYGLKDAAGMLYEMAESVNPGRVGGWIDVTIRATPTRIKWDSYMVAMHLDAIAAFADKGVFQGEAGQPMSEVEKHYRAMSEAWGNIEKMEEYLYGARTVSDVGIAWSELTAGNRYVGFEGAYGYFGNVAGIYIMFMKNHMPVRAFTLEGTTEDMLSSYKVLVVPKAECMTERQVEMLRDWVGRGGVLIATGRTSACDRYGLEMGNYALSDVFGVDLLGHKFMSKGELSFNLTSEMRLVYYPKVPERFRGDPLYLVDSVRVHDGAQVVGRWGDGSPAAVLNRYGKGASLFLTAPNVGLKFGQEDWLVFWGDLMDWALGEAGASRPVELSGCPRDVQVNLREQEAEGGRRVLHMLCSEDREISGVEAKVALRDGHGAEEVVEVLSGVRIPYSVGRNYVMFEVPSFKMYTCIAISMGKETSPTKLPELPQYRPRPRRARSIPEELYEVPPWRDLAGLRVGVFRWGEGAGAIKDALVENLSEIKLRYVENLVPDQLEDLDVLIIPAFNPWRVRNFNREWRRVVREWVEKGHGLLATHVSIGYRYTGVPIFPEISAGASEGGHPVVPEWVVVEEHPVTEGLELGRIYRHIGYIDHITVRPGPEGYVLAKDFVLGPKDPVVVIGAPGEGRYVACGILLRESTVPDESGRVGLPITGAELKLLLNSVRWLALPAMKAK